MSGGGQLSGATVLGKLSCSLTKVLLQSNITIFWVVFSNYPYWSHKGNNIRYCLLIAIKKSKKIWTMKNCDVLRDLVPFAQFIKRD